MRSRRMKVLSAAIAALVVPTAAAGHAAAAPNAEFGPALVFPQTAAEKAEWVRNYGVAYIHRARVVAQSDTITVLRLKVQLPTCWKLVTGFVYEESGAAYIGVVSLPRVSCTPQTERTIKTRNWVVSVSPDVNYVAGITGDLVAANIR